MPLKKNIGTLFRYIGESAALVRQGAAWKDRLILFSYFLKIPLTVVKSLSTGKTFREIEEKNKKLRGPVTLKNRHGRFYCGDNILTVYTVNANSEKHIYPYIESTEGVFIDVGAHIGKYSIAAAKNPALLVISIEPDQHNFSLLKKNIALNNVQHIICLNKGAYSSMAKIPFYTTEAGEGMHSIYRQPESRQEGSIEADTLDNMISQLQVNKTISLIKIDVEGAEYEVLKGAENILEQFQPNLIIEVWRDSASRLEQVEKFLQGFGYGPAQYLDKENVLFASPKNA